MNKSEKGLLSLVGYTRFPLASILTVFVLAKLLGVISWPWGWVLVPLWVGGGIAVWSMVMVVTIMILGLG